MKICKNMGLEKNRNNKTAMSHFDGEASTVTGNGGFGHERLINNNVRRKLGFVVCFFVYEAAKHFQNCFIHLNFKQISQMNCNQH
jgi:hypothetical protein